MTRTGKVFSWLGGIVLLAIVALAIFIATFDWNRLKPTINDKVSAELRRPFAIRGDLGVDWSRNRDEGGWRAWCPGRIFTLKTCGWVTRKTCPATAW